MAPQSRFGNGSSQRLTSSQPGHHAGAAWVSARHRLLSDSWTGDVEKLEWAISRFKIDSDVANNCQVVFFEIAGDGHLHCNVTHRHPMKTVTGWAGPGEVPDGFVYNRRFGNTPRNEVVRHIHDMVFAARL